MAFKLDQIAPWGRSFGEYVRMFALTEADRQKAILGCGDGPASFNAVMNERGRRVVSVDPLYRFSAEELERRIQQVYTTMIEQLVANRSAYVWTSIRTPENLGRIRMEAMTTFLKDFEPGKAEGRYLAHELPRLPFADDEFDLALCSHLLFTYSDHLSMNFHLQSVIEMCRIATEVRVFPLLDQGGEPSSHVHPVCVCLRHQGLRFEIQPVEYEFQRGGNKMLRICRG